MAPRKDLEIEIVQEAANKISITFPPGIRAAVRKRIAADELLAFLRGTASTDEAEAESGDGGIRIETAFLGTGEEAGESAPRETG